MVLEIDDSTPRYRATVLTTELLTPASTAEEIRELVIEIEDSAFTFEVGQNIAVILPGESAFGQPEHVRFYTIADAPGDRGGHPVVALCIRRCDYVDEYSGERFQGLASTRLCAATEGTQLTVAGPFGSPFEIPEDESSNLLMIGLGTGIAPFRAFVRQIYEHLGGWRGKVRLFYGAHTGLEAAYMNDHKNDIAQYLDEDTFEAFRALSPRPHRNEPAAIDEALALHEVEVWRLLQDPKTYVYVAGRSQISATLDRVFSQMAGGDTKWARRKAELVAGRRWAELTY